MTKTLNEILLMQPGSEIRIGDGAPGVNFSGIRIYKTMSGFGFESYVEGVLRQYLGSDGNWHQSSGDPASQPLAPSGQLVLDYKDLLEGDNVWKGLNTFLLGLILGDNAYLGSAAFASGFDGAGLWIGQNADGKWEIDCDAINVRGAATFSELLFSQVRATNGSIWVSSTGKIKHLLKQT